MDIYGVSEGLEPLNETALQNNCIEQNDIQQKGKISKQSHSTGCTAEYGESHCSEMNQLET